MRPSTYTALFSLVLTNLISPILGGSTTTETKRVNCSDSLSQIEIAQGSGDSPVVSYNWENAIDISCPSQDYLVTFDVDQTSDIYFAISTQRYLPTDSEVIEGVVGVNTGTWYVGASVYSLEEDIMSGASDTQRIYVQVNSSGVSIGLVGNSMPILTLPSTYYDINVAMNSPNLWFAFGAERDLTLIQNVEYTCNSSTCVNPSSSTDSSRATESSPTDSSSTSSTSTESSSTESPSTESSSTESSSTESSSTESSSTDSSSTESSSTQSSSTSFTSSSSSTCGSTSVGFNIIVSSTNKNKDYDFKQALTIPCDTSDFEFTASISATTDFFVALMNDSGFYSPNGVVEAQFGLSSGVSSIKKGKYALVKRSNIFTRADSQDIKIVYKNSQLQIFINNSLKSTYKVSNFNMTSLAMTPFKGTASVFNPTFSCQSISNCSN